MKKKKNEFMTNLGLILHFHLVYNNYKTIHRNFKMQYRQQPNYKLHHQLIKKQKYICYTNDCILYTFFHSCHYEEDFPIHHAVKPITVRLPQ